MKRTLLILALIAMTAVAGLAQGDTKATPTATPTPVPMKFKVGDVAPDFTLPDTAGNKVKLSDFRGKNNVVLAFFVLAFTGG